LEGINSSVCSASDEPTSEDILFMMQTSSDNLSESE
jgi:hypothetical protein